MLLLVSLAAADDPVPENRSGVQVVGRSRDDQTPESWSLLAKTTGAVVAKVERKWGFAEVPPGDYALKLLPRGHEAVEIPWGDVRVEEGRPTKVEIASGVELAAGDENERVLESWDVLDKATGARIAHAWRRWGFAPLTPGTYSLRLQPQGHEAIPVSWGDVTVEAGRTTAVRVDSGISVKGRDAGEKELERWQVLEKASGKKVAYVWRRWGFTPLPAGSYVVEVVPAGYDAIPIRWAEVDVAPSRSVDVPVATGVDLSGRAEDDGPPEHWILLDKATGRPAARTWRRWGFTPVRPGTYGLRVQPAGRDTLELSWGDVEVKEASVASVRLASGIELEGRPGAKPPNAWDVLDAKSQKPVAHVVGRWGVTAVPPGTYDVVRTPMRWDGVVVREGEVATVKEPGMAERWSRVTGAGRKTEKERDPEGYRKLEEEVERAIRRAAAWLKKQSPIVDMDPKRSDGHPTIGILALVHSGELDRDRALARRSRDLLLRRPLNDRYGTYATALTAMALRDMGGLRHRARIRECATWLVENQGWKEDRMAWGYGKPLPGFEDMKPAEAPGARAAPGSVVEVARRGLVPDASDSWDNSNTQFAVLGLHSAAQARIDLPKECWERVERHFRAVQNPDTGWGYGRGSSTGSMTCSGLASLLVARHHLGAEAGVPDPAIVGGLEWLDAHFTLEGNPGSKGDQYYYLYGLERVGVLAGIEFIGEHEWYPLGARYLLSQQRSDGSWIGTKSPPTGGPGDYLDTSYAILFLRRATLPLQTEAPALLGVTSDAKALRKDLAPAVELIFDSSGSMKDPVEGTPKIQIARSVLKEVLRELPPDLQVGLRLYGHRGVWLARARDPAAAALDPNDPRLKKDSELVVSIGPLDDARRGQIGKWIDWAQPRGWTPMVFSLLEARRDFPAAGRGARSVVLVSDGEETGGGRLEDVAAAYRGSGIEVKIHVVGFDIEGTDAERQLQEIARLGKGRYYGAKNAGDLAQALLAAVPSLGFEVLDAAGAVVASGPLDGEPVEVAPGRYRVRLSGLESEPVEVTLQEADETYLKVDGAGKLTR